MSEESQYSEHPGGWIEWFCALEDHSFLCEIDEDFIRDSFNQYGLKQRFNFFNEALEMILSPEMPEDHDLEDERFIEVYQEATDIYGLIHARFITTSKGLAIMRERLLQGRFGYCPRVYCEKQHVIPIGLCEDLKTARVKVFCPRCQETYIPKKKCADIDGAYFGKSFPQLLLLTHTDIEPKHQLLPDTKLMTLFEPTLYGFKLYGKKGSHFEGKALPQPSTEPAIISSPQVIIRSQSPIIEPPSEAQQQALQAQLQKQNLNQQLVGKSKKNKKKKNQNLQVQ